MTKELYKADVHVAGGRDGHAVSDDGHLDVALALPKAIGGSGAGSNPEQLFAAGFGACFASSIRFSALQMKLDTGDVSVDAQAALTVSDDGRYGLKVALTARIPGLGDEDRARVLAEAERICAYTNATRGNVELAISIRD